MAASGDEYSMLVKWLVCVRMIREYWMQLFKASNVRVSRYMCARRGMQCSGGGDD
jgi:hypothetical protein